MSKYNDIIYVRVTENSKKLLDQINTDYLMKQSDYIRLALTNQLIADGLFPNGKKISTSFKKLKEIEI